MVVRVELNCFAFDTFYETDGRKIISVEQQQEGTVLVLYKEKNVEEPQVKQWENVYSVTVDW